MNEKKTNTATLRNHLWLWCHPAGVYNALPGLPGHSDCTPAGAAAFFGIDRILMVVYGDAPAPPFEPVQRELAGMKQVIWSVVGDSSSGREDDCGAVLDLRREFPNLAGGIVDDALKPGRETLLPELAGRLRRAGLPLWLVVYDHDLDKPGLADMLKYCDVISFWTWNADRLGSRAENLCALQAMAPGKPVALGCYLWNFPEGREIPPEVMKSQLDEARNWLLNGTIRELVLLGSPLVGMPLPAIEQARDFVRTFS